MRGSAVERAKAWQPGQPVRLDTARTVIRSMTADDVTERYVSWFADAEVMRHITMDMNLSRAELLEFVASFDNAERFHFGVFLKDSGLPIGWLKILCDLPDKRGIMTTVIGDRDYWGRGFGFEMRTAIIDFMFDVLGLHKAVSKVYSDSLPAQGLNTKLGFRREGILLEHEVGRGGEWRDVHVFGILADEWRRRRNTP
ncbi:MAG: GNAT family N-acetyltransferase [Rhodospirillales bacterium]